MIALKMCWFENGVTSLPGCANEKDAQRKKLCKENFATENSDNDLSKAFYL